MFTGSIAYRKKKGGGGIKGFHAIYGNCAPLKGSTAGDLVTVPFFINDTVLCLCVSYAVNRLLFFIGNFIWTKSPACGPKRPIFSENLQSDDDDSWNFAFIML